MSTPIQKDTPPNVTANVASGAGNEGRVASDKQPKLCGKVQMAEMVSRTPATLLSWARDGVIPSIKVNRRTILFDPERVIAAIAAFERHVEA